MKAKHPFLNRYAERGYQWWFAWHPVKMPDGKWVWLRWVTRRWVTRRWLGDYHHG